MRAPRRTSNILGKGALGLLVGGMILHLITSRRVQATRAMGCAELWNAPANRANRSMVRGRAFSLATVRASDPARPGGRAVWCCCGNARMDPGC